MAAMLQAKRGRMPPWGWGVVAGAIFAVALGVAWPGSAGAGTAFLVPLYALIACPLGVGLAHFISRLAKFRCRNG